MRVIVLDSFALFVLPVERFVLAVVYFALESLSGAFCIVVAWQSFFSKKKKKQPF